MKVDAILVDQAEFGEASRQVRAGNLDLPGALGLQSLRELCRKSSRPQPLHHPCHCLLAGGGPVDVFGYCAQTVG